MGNPRTFVAVLPVGDQATGAERIQGAGLELVDKDGKVLIDNVTFGSPAEAAGLSFDQVVRAVRVPADQPHKEWMFIPALIVLALVVVMQRFRRTAAVPVAA